MTTFTATPTPATPATPQSTEKDIPFRGLVTLSIMLATIMQVLDTTIANVALPHMQGSLSATQDQVTWVLTSYIVASAIMTLPTAWLAGRYGRKNIFLFAVGGFTLTSVLCGMAISIEQMVLFRVLQGCFGAALVPLAQATMLDINPRERHGKAMAMWGMGVMIGPILGPTLGGWLTEYYNWRWVFYINLPLGIVAFTGMLLFMPDSERSDRAFDKFGFLMLCVIIGSAQLLMDRGEHSGWFGSREILLYAALAGSALWMYIIHSMRTDNPFLSPALFRDRNLITSLVFIFFIGIILLATMALLPPYMQNLMGYPVMDVGIIMAPRGIGTMLAMMMVGRLSNSVDVRVLILFGLGCTASSLFAMTGFSTYVPPQTLVWTGMLQGFGLGFIFVPLSTVAYATLAPQLRAEGASVFSLSRNMGSSVGISVVMAVLSRNMQTNHAYLTENVTAEAVGANWSQVPQSLFDNAAGMLGMIDAEITRQAATIAYLNDFKLMMWVVIAAAPLVLLLRKAAPRTAH
ncbi:MAG: DHA2 family efflux MFS transporter permease subunit [Gammaproteobacteria bacterium]|nr:DHA2 family efflux MFS transporter permease subunit [Gammaproteobacteria bacterium]MDP2141241.1 DHA2 family efflux MFS transporter permease subunit [Gammaproteobacteria bacterium]MDP2349085.1 DHA2 family efflux MFS transporter permease subunit [Gammaproteobacteria bacterium]